MRSKTLSDVARRDRRVTSYDYYPARDAPHVLYLAWPWSTTFGGAATGRTVAECLRELRMAFRGCDGCGERPCVCLPDED